MKNKIWWVVIGLIILLVASVVVGSMYIAKFKKESEASQALAIAALRKDLATTSTANVYDGQTLTLPAKANVIGAIYGTNGGTNADVTEVIQSKVSLTAPVDILVNATNMGADPAPGVTKKLSITYQI